jgi:hypothetical protein
MRTLENPVVDLLDPGQPLPISAEGKSRMLPSVTASRGRAGLQKISDAPSGPCSFSFAAEALSLTWCWRRVSTHDEHARGQAATARLCSNDKITRRVA